MKNKRKRAWHINSGEVYRREDSSVCSTIGKIVHSRTCVIPEGSEFGRAKRTRFFILNMSQDEAITCFEQTCGVTQARARERKLYEAG